MIKFVGGNFVSGIASTGTYDVSLTELTGGIDTAARVGDFVVAHTAYSAGTGSVSSTGVSGSDTNLYTNLYKAAVAETIDPSACVAYKYLTADADLASVTVFGTVTAGYGRIGMVSVWRGVDSVTPLIASQSGANSGTNSPLPVFAAVTPTIPGSVVLEVGTCSLTSAVQLVVGANYTNAVGCLHIGSGTAKSGIAGRIGYRFWPGYAAETPASMTGPTDTNAEGFIAHSLVLNPVANKSVFTTSNT